MRATSDGIAMHTQPHEIIRVDDADQSAGCDGGAGALGHPMIYLRFDGKAWVDCYYCGRRFAKSGDTAAPAGAAAPHAA